MPPPPPECLSRPGGIRIMAPKIFPKIFPQNPPKKFTKIFPARKTLKRKHVKAYFIRACGYTHTREENEKNRRVKPSSGARDTFDFLRHGKTSHVRGRADLRFKSLHPAERTLRVLRMLLKARGTKKAFERESQESQVETPMTPNRKRGGPPGSKDSKPRKRRRSNSPKRCIKKYGGDSRQPRSDIPLMTKRCSYKCTRE